MSNLPDDVTPGDIDDAHAPPDEERILGTVTVAAEAVVPAHASDRERREALMGAVDGDAIDAEVGEVERP